MLSETGLFNFSLYVKNLACSNDVDTVEIWLLFDSMTFPLITIDKI